MPCRNTVFRWLDNNTEFQGQYARAREQQAEFYAAEIIEIADEKSNDYITVTKRNGESFQLLNKEAVMRSSLRVDARKWYASKLAPKKYGDLKQVEHSGSVTLEQLIAGESHD